MSILDDLGLDADTVEWEDLATCKNMEIEWFYEDYENDQVHAANIDQICLNCPVLMACAKSGRSNKEEGTWGGVYWTNGKVDHMRNRHKTDDVWKALEKRTGMKLK